MAASTSSRFSRPPAPERLLEVAGELFYAEGINTVGVDRIAAAADASKATLYAHYRSKDGLVAAYLEQRSARTRERLAEHLEEGGDARAKLLRIFDALPDWHAEDDFRGCHFIVAGGELTDPEHPGIEVGRRHRAWVRGLFEDLAGELGAADPALLAAQLLMLYDGATVAADLDSYKDAGRAARAAAGQLIEQA
jgi:AcrR family transcriptional regulator